MKKYFYVVLSVFFCASSLLNAEKKEKNTYDSEVYRPERPVHFFPFKNCTSESIDLALLEKILADCLVRRKSPQFAVRNAETADIGIQVEILRYQYSKQAVSSENKKRNLLDNFAEKNAAALDAVFSVRSRKGSLLWKEKIHADYSQNNMTREEALIKVFNKTCRRFISKCFGKSSPLSN